VLAVACALLFVASGGVSVKAALASLGICLVVGCSGAAVSPIASEQTTTGSDASLEDGKTSSGPGVVGIYSECSPIALDKTYASPKGFSFSYPSGWDHDPSIEVYGLTTSYSYLPTGESSTVTTTAIVGLTLEGPNNNSMIALEQVLGAYPGAVSSSFEVQGHAAVAYWFKSAPPQAGCSSCPTDPGPDIVTIGVAAVMGSEVVALSGSARVDAPPSVFCDIQGIEGSLSFSQ
jgi:hypothetical protein